MLGLRIKLPNINHWNALCIVRAKVRRDREGCRAMESVKIYLLMAIITVIAAASHRKDRRDANATTNDRSADAARV
jgi:hypothetical protein